MSLDDEVRGALLGAADRHRPGTPDLDALVRAGQERRRRRQNHGLVAVVAAVAVVAGLGAAAGLRGGGPGPGSDSPQDGSSSRVVRATTVPWCVPDRDDPDGEELVVGVGAPVKTWCGHDAPDGDGALWHHAGRTLLVRSNGVYLVADGRLAWLHETAYGNVVFSQDGRYAAWLVRRHADCRGLELDVYDLGSAKPVARSVVPTVDCSIVRGIDDLGRVYVDVEGPRAPDLRMYDVWAGRWTEVTDLPPGTGPVTYVTARGLAVQREELVVEADGYRDALPVASVEGVVDRDGRLVRQRPVPVGRGVWSPGRTLVADQQPAGVVVRRTGNLDQRLLLDLPPGRFRITSRHVPHTNLQWESPVSVLVATLDPTGQPSYRCDVRTGRCTLLDRAGDMALGIGVQPAG